MVKPEAKRTAVAELQKQHGDQRTPRLQAGGIETLHTPLPATKERAAGNTTRTRAVGAIEGERQRFGYRVEAGKLSGAATRRRLARCKRPSISCSRTGPEAERMNPRALQLGFRRVLRAEQVQPARTHFATLHLQRKL